MPAKRSTFRLGLAVIVMFVLFVTCLLMIGGGTLSMGPRTQIVVRFGAGGTLPEISKGSFVMYLGQKVGVVERTEFVEALHPEDPQITDHHFLETVVAIDRDLGLREDCRVVASGPPLGGGGTLSILSRGHSPVMVQPDQPIYAQPAGFQAVMDMLTRELDDHNALGLIARIKTQLDVEDARSLVAKFHQTADSVKEFTSRIAEEVDRERRDALLVKVLAAVDELTSGLAEIDAMLEENRPRVDSTLASLDAAAARLDEDVLAVLASELQLEEEQDATLLTRMHNALGSLNESLDDLNVVSSETKEVVVLNKERINHLVENAVAASLHLKLAIKDIKRHPSKLWRQPSEGERRELHMFDVAREFSEAAGYLDNSTSRLKALLEANEGGIARDDPVLREVLAELASAVEKFGAAEQALWSELAVD